MGCYLYGVVSSLHVHSFLLMDFLNIENKHCLRGALFHTGLGSFLNKGDLAEHTVAGISDVSD